MAATSGTGAASTMSRSARIRRGGRPPTPPKTPPEIVETIAWEPREPIPLPRPIASPVAPPADQPRPKHKLVVLGDSVSQGFRSLAIHDTSLSWPAMVAGYGGLTPFRYPDFPGPEDCPGLPLNLEEVLRGIDWPRTGADLIKDARLLRRLHQLCDSVEDYWERRDGADQILAARADPDRDLGRINHNLACWGQDVRDAFALTMGDIQQRIKTAAHRGDDVLGVTPSSSYERSAAITMAGAQGNDTCLSLARALGDDGGIETLVVALGANNILSSVIDFNVTWTDDPTVGGHYDDVDHKGGFTAWTPEHFRSEYDLLMDQVAQVRARNVIALTVPHVTIVPAVRGVGTKMYHDRYFARYTRPWISDDEFSPNRHPCLTGDQLRVLDFAVDLYNEHIVQCVRERAGATADQRWAVLDIAGLLDRLAFRRYLIDDQSKPDWWTSYDLPEAFLELSPVPDTRYFGSDRFGRTQGGLISLDGVHPTTLGYSLIAREVMNLMTTLGVPLAAAEPDYRAVICADSLLGRPLPQLDSVLNGVDFINRTVDLFQAFRGQPPL